MDKPLHDLDWTLLRSFLAVADHGSYSAAGRALRLSQPTVGRHIELLEEATGLHLFDRAQRGMNLTLVGERLLPSVRAMHAAANQAQLIAAGAED
ncbi:MAG: LysR family transcriptional regulator, partial [Rhodobacteraceae bacterium]|nr:LysR family transcriptional regulator [Paracoccaceae bacterium]